MVATIWFDGGLSCSYYSRKKSESIIFCVDKIGSISWSMQQHSLQTYSHLPPTYHRNDRLNHNNNHHHHLSGSANSTSIDFGREPILPFNHHHGNSTNLSAGWTESQTTEPSRLLLPTATPTDNKKGVSGGDRENGGSDKSPLYVMGMNLHKFSASVQMGVCVAGVLVLYLLYGYSQEWIFRVKGFRQFGWYLTLLQFFFYSVFGALERTLQKENCRRIPLSTYVVIAFLTVATMGLSNASLGYLNYPTQVIFKSCKLVPVMIGGIIIQGKRYKLLNGVAVMLMSIGLVIFNMADLSVEPNMNKTGILLISLALCADAVIGNLQEKAMKMHSGSNLEMIFYSYSIGTVYILVWVTLSGSFIPAFIFCIQNPELYLMIAVFSLTGYLGINFVLALVRTNGALVAVTVTTLRKTLTVVLSFLVFTKPFTLQYLWGGLLVLLGILLNVYFKNSVTVDGHLRLARLRLCFWLRRGRNKYAAQEFAV